jgi:hypothetical protein
MEKRRYRLLFGLFQTTMMLDGVPTECTFKAGDEFECEADLLSFNGKGGMTPKFQLLDGATADENLELRAEIAKLKAELREAREAVPAGVDE